MIIQPPAVQLTEVDQNLSRIHEGLSNYLESLGLPSENILAPLDERREIVTILPSVVNRMTSQQRETATYVSKFTAAVTTGLFDAALNYLWDETIRNLRNRVCSYDLQYFYDTAITDPSERAKFKSESDLQNIRDWNLIHVCQGIGLISELALKHLDFIRDMRNFASAAHPNQNQLTGLQLVQWMDTCIRDVLTKEPLAPAIEAKRLLRNLREIELDKDKCKPINQAISALGPVLLTPLLRTVFGMYVDSNISAMARNNIKLVAKIIWQGSPAAARYEIGLKYGSFRAHGESERAKLAREFISSVDGLSYLPESDLELELSNALRALSDAHNGWGNFYSEPMMAIQLEKLVPQSGKLPDGARSRYVEVLTMCKLTNGRGNAWNAESVYDRLIGDWQANEILEFLVILTEPEIRSRLQFPLCRDQLHMIVGMLQENTSSALALEGLDYIIDRKKVSGGKAALESGFSQIVDRIRAVI